MAKEYADLWRQLTTTGKATVTLAPHRVNTVIEAVKKRKWRQNVRRINKGLKPYETLSIRLQPLSDRYVKLTFTLPQRLVI